MPLAAWVMLIAVGIAVAFIALALLRVIVNLSHVTTRLDKTIDVVGRIPNFTRPVPEVLSSVNGNLEPVRKRAEQLDR